MKFKVGDILINGYGYRYEVLRVRRDNPMYPYAVGSLVNKALTYTYGANGEFYGTGNPGSTFDVTLDVDYVISKMWEEYEV
jgi:hypothetical protein